MSNPDATLGKSLHFLVAQLAAVRKPCAGAEPPRTFEKIHWPVAKMAARLFSFVRARMQMGMKTAPMSSGGFGHARHKVRFRV